MAPSLGNLGSIHCQYRNGMSKQCFKCHLMKNVLKKRCCVQAVTTWDGLWLNKTCNQLMSRTNDSSTWFNASVFPLLPAAVLVARLHYTCSNHLSETFSQRQNGSPLGTNWSSVPNWAAAVLFYPNFDWCNEMSTLAQSTKYWNWSIAPKDMWITHLVCIKVWPWRRMKCQCHSKT
jgi:hypothetical protein